MTRIKTFMLTTDYGASEDYNVFYCPIYRVSGEGDFSEKVFKKYVNDDQLWVEEVEYLGYEVERIELNYVILDDEEEVEDDE